MLGSARETILTLMVNIYSDEAEQTGNVPTNRGMPKPLLDWQFVKLLRAAIRAAVMEVTVPKPGERIQWRVVDDGAGRLGRHRSRFHDFWITGRPFFVLPAFQMARGCEGVSSLLDGTFKGGGLHSQSSIGGSLQSGAWHPCFQDARRSKRPFPSA